jgi:hypothetical protein
LERSHLNLLLLLIANPACAATQLPKSVTFNPIINAPIQQSECEIKSNRVMAAHPHSDSFKLMNRYGVFFFGLAPPPLPPSVYRDAKSSITFYVESDGRHIAAIDDHGKILWVRNPYVDSDMCPYRSAHPFISSLGPVVMGGHIALDDAEIQRELLNEIKRGRRSPPPQANDRFVGLTFNSSNFGYLNIRTGDYYDMGQN